MINGFLKTDITCDSSSLGQSVAARGVISVSDVISENMSHMKNNAQTVRSHWPAADPLLPLLVDPLQVGVQVVLPVRPLAVVRLEVEAGIVPAAGVAHVVLGEPVLVLPPLSCLLGAQLWDGEVLLPVMGPVELPWRRLTSPGISGEWLMMQFRGELSSLKPVCCGFLTNAHAVD